MALLYGPIPHPNLRGSARLVPRFLPDLTAEITLPITKGALVLTGQGVFLNGVAAETKVRVATLRQRWNGAAALSLTGIGYQVRAFNHSTQAVGALLAGGTGEVTDGAGLLEIATTTLGLGVGDYVLVTIWKLAGGPAGEDVTGASIEQVVAGP